MWKDILKVSEEETEKVAGAVTTSSAAHSHLFRPTYGKRRKRKKKKEEDSE